MDSTYEFSKKPYCVYIRRWVSGIFTILYILLYSRLKQFNLGKFDYSLFFNETDNTNKFYSLNFDVIAVVQNIAPFVECAIWGSIILFVMVEVCWKDKKKVGYFVHMLTMTLGATLAIAHLIQYLILWKIDITKMAIFFIIVIYIALCITMMIFDLVCYIVIKDEKKESHWRLNLCLFVVNILIVGIVALQFFNTFKEHNKLVAYKEDQERHGDELNKDVEYQMGNYANRYGFYGDGTIFIYGNLKDIGNGLYEKTVYKIDGEGNYEKVFSYVDKVRKLQNMAYYDGWVYTYEGNEGDNETICSMVRFSVDTGEKEVVFTSESRLGYGIVDNILYYFDWKTEQVVPVKCMDLDGDLSSDNSYVYDSGYLTESLGEDFFIGRILYNKAEDYTISSQEVYFRQFYNEYTYNYFDVVYYYDEYDVLNNWKDYPDGLVFRENDNGTLEPIAENVEIFNIFNDEMYYVKKAEEGYELWKCAMDGSDKTYIAFLDSIIKRTDGSGGDMYAIGLTLGEDYAVCDIGENIRYYEAERRYIINLDTGEVQKVEP